VRKLKCAQGTGRRGSKRLRPTGATGGSRRRVFILFGALFAITACGDRDYPGALLAPSEGNRDYYNEYSRPASLEELGMIAQAVQGINTNAHADCAAAADALNAMLLLSSNGNNRFRVYDSTYRTDIGFYNGSQTQNYANDIIGFHELNFTEAMTEGGKARTALHEGAHAAGFGDTRAYQLELLCVVSDI
jgi:hypothetical protein